MILLELSLISSFNSLISCMCIFLVILTAEQNVCDENCSFLLCYITIFLVNETVVNKVDKIKQNPI